MASDIAKIVKKLTRKYDTQNPWEIASQLKIKVSIEPMEAKIKGVFTCPLRIKQIILNSNLDEFTMLIVLAHELGHAVLHTNCGIGFIKEHTLFPTGRYEIQANKFAAELLLDDSSLDILKEYGSIGAAQFLGVPIELIEYKWLSKPF